MKTTRPIVRHVRATHYLGVTLLLAIFWFPLGATPLATSQQHVDPPRSSLDFRCPEYVASGMSPITLQADILGVDSNETLKRVVFKWKLSSGKLLRGQGTYKIVINPYEPSNEISNIKVELEIEGGPPELEKKKCCLLRVDPKCVAPRMIDQYSQASLADERQHLDQVAGYLGEAPDSVAYILSYAGKSACIYEAEWRADRVQEYLVKKHNILRDRIVLVGGGFREDWTVEVFILARGSCGPLPSPTLTRGQVHVSGQCSDKQGD